MTALSLLICAPLSAESWLPSPISGWSSLVFEGETIYRQLPDCVLAEARDSASGLIQAGPATLASTPWLLWGWRAEQAPQGQRPGVDELSREDDDFRARVYVIHRGFFPWQTKAINYVWSQAVPMGSDWRSPYTGNSVLVAVQQGEAELGQWRYFARNVQADFRHYHGMEIERIDAVAVMTDTDNRGGTAQTCFDMPRFVSKAVVDHLWDEIGP